MDSNPAMSKPNSEHEEEEGNISVTRQIRLKPAGGRSQELDKDVVLRRIRRRQRTNSLKNTVQALFGCNAASVQHHPPPCRWVDDAFAAP